MPKIKRPGPIGPPETGGEWDGRKKVRKLSKSPCNRPPSVATGARVRFHVREAKTHLEYSTVVNWSEVTEDTYGFPTRIGRYYVQLRPTNQWGNPIHWVDDPDGWEEWTGTPDAPPNGAKQLIHKRTVDKPKDQDPDDWAHVSFGSTVRPKKWYYQARVRAEDTDGCKGEWTEWCDAVNALQLGASRPLPPTPTGVHMEFDVIDRGRWDRYSAVVTMNEVGHWDIPGGDDEDDVAFYSCQLQGGPSINGPWDGKVRTHTRSAKDGDNDSTVTFHFGNKIKKHRWYRARARTIDRFNRRGAWSGWTVGGSPSDNNPPPNPQQVEAYGRHNHIGIDWVDPNHPQDPELAHPDIAYAQVQLASSASFGASVLRFDKMVMGSRKEWESTAYKRRYWLRVRYIDGSDNKGSWVQAGPVRPQKTAGTRVVASGVTTRDAATTMTGAIVGVGNRAYRSGSGLSIAVLEGETNTGTLRMRLQASRSSAMAAGAVLRYTNTSNYLILRLANSLELVTRVGGSETTRVSGVAVEPSGLYDVDCTISEGGQVTVMLDGIARGSYSLTESERAALSGTRHGVYFGSADSNSRVEWIQWTPTGATVPSFEDEFVRPASSASLGTADSGDAWVTISGQVGVSPDSVPDAVFADLWANGDSNKLGEISIPNSGHIKLGENGLNSGAISVEIDRPTRFVAMGNSAIENSGANEFTGMLYLVCVDTATGVEYLGKAGRTFCAVNDYTDSRPRHVSAIHDVFINCPEGSSRIVNWWWGYRCGGTNTRHAYIGPQVMFVQWREAHDVVDGPGLTRPAGLRKAKAIDRYRRAQNNE